MNSWITRQRHYWFILLAFVSTICVFGLFFDSREMMSGLSATINVTNVFMTSYEGITDTYGGKR